MKPSRGARRTAVAALVVAGLPLAGYAALVSWMRAHGAATLMLGAASGAGGAEIAAMGLALLLRVYTVVVLPGVVVAWAVTRAWRVLAGRRATTPAAGPRRDP